MRLPTGGQIDRKTRIPFTWDGKGYIGHPGDTLASALLANDVRLMGRSFKYHRPRGVLSAGSEEPNALVTIGQGAAADPNTRATQQEIYPGLTATSQNRLGPLSFDLIAINDHLAPFIGTGFYYKTFMWPKTFWEKLYEPIIRRAAGLGALSGEADPDHHEKAWAHCDLLVIGSGPAGLMAAITAARAGRDVILADEDFALGGRLNSEVDLLKTPDWLTTTLTELASLPNVRLMPRTTITGAYDSGTYGAFERVSSHLRASNGRPKGCFWRIVAPKVVLATGALERMIAFPNNDRPGIMLASAVRSYVTRFGVSPGRRVVVFANNDQGAATVHAMRAAGVRVGALVDTRPAPPTRPGVLSYPGGRIVDTRGRLGLSAVKIRDAEGNETWTECDCLAVAGGWNPALHLTCHLGARPRWEDTIAAFVPTPNSVPGMRPAGAADGIFSTHGALHSGADAAATALDIPRAKCPKAEDRPYTITPFWVVEGRKRAWLDPQNDVTVKDVAQAAAESFRSVEHMKRYTTLGMATDQGKAANVPGLAVLADATGRTIAQTGTTTFRPPYTPVPIAAMGAGGAGKGFAPERLTPSHAVSIQRKDVMLEAGLWYRPAYTPHDGDTHWRQACDREVGYVRNAVGVSDVSTLGKIDVQGPDAARFLDFVYTNTMSSLKVGRVRYGLMLREDGFIMDDGTVARLEKAHFRLTTTTAAAGQVMSHLEFARQCLGPWDVTLQSVTDQWAQISVAGPKARALLEDAVTADISDAALPYMSHAPITIAGVAGQIFRISFSGERAFEVAMPARYGASLMRYLVGKAEALGGGAYGLEALNVLRIEKGFMTHAEIDGRVTAADCGYGRMVSAKTDCIGKTLSQRPALTDTSRPQLVGLRPAGAAKRFFGGSHIVDLGAETTSENDLGHVTSVCYSPTLGAMIGLGFVQNGRARLGDIVRAVDLLRGFDTECEIVSPVFFDPDGERLRG